MKSAFLKYYHRLIPIVLGLIALAVPLLRDFHIESALLAAFVGCLWAGWKATLINSEKSDLKQCLPILGYLFLFGLPLFIFTVLTGCFSIHGLGFWLLYPVPSVFFGFALVRLIRIWKVPLGNWTTITLLLLISFGVLLFEFYNYPQVYFFNHVWGGWPGPIYDETVQVTKSLIYFRLLTFLWIILLWFIPDFKSYNKARWLVVISLLAMVFSYTRLPEAGIISPASYIQDKLGAIKQTPHFDIYFAKDYYTSDEINRIALEHEFYFEQITNQLQISKPDSNHKIESYLYAHPWQKKELVGAKFTSYVPVWLEQDQLHIAKQQLDGSLKHEMVHVLAKQFGNKLINASWSIGLVEGLAVAIAPNESRISTIDQLVVSERPLPGAEEMKQALSPMGFYGGRSNVNYTTTGSFVQYLLKNYPVAKIKEAYQSGSVSEAYQLSFEKLVEDWHKHLETVSVDSVDQRIARRLFSIPSLFEKACPHILTDFAKHWDDYRYYTAERDTGSALTSLNEAFMLKPDNPFIKSEWAFINLKKGTPEKVQTAATMEDTLVDLQLLYADAFALTGDYAEAKKYLNNGAELFQSDPDSITKVAVETRMDSMQWKYYLELRYDKNLFNKEIFQELLYRTKIRTVDLVIENEQWSKLRTYSQLLYEFPADTKYFHTYLNMVHLLGYLQEWELAGEWLDKLEKLEKRQRFSERLQQECRWIEFLIQKDTAKKIINEQGDKYSLSIIEANWKSLLIVLPLAAVTVFVYSLVWGWSKTGSDFMIIYTHYGTAIFLLIAGTFVHELLHGLSWMKAANLDWDDIKYGFKLRVLTPYAHCKQPIAAKAYRVGILAPGFILGILPFIGSLIIGDAWLLVFGFIFTLAAGGDFLMFWIIRDIPKDSLVEDHPERVGCEVVSQL